MVLNALVSFVAARDLFYEEQEVVVVVVKTEKGKANHSSRKTEILHGAGERRTPKRMIRKLAEISLHGS